MFRDQKIYSSLFFRKEIVPLETFLIPKNWSCVAFIYSVLWAVQKSSHKAHGLGKIKQQKETKYSAGVQDGELKLAVKWGPSGYT